MPVCVTVLEEQVCNTFDIRKEKQMSISLTFCFNISLEILNFSIGNLGVLFQGHTGRPKFHPQQLFSSKMSGSSFSSYENFEQVSCCLSAPEIFGNILVQIFFIFVPLVTVSLVISVVIFSFTDVFL
jgi:hypothetical protein